MYLYRAILITLFIGCLLGISTSPVEAARKKKNKKKNTATTTTNEVEEDEKLKLNSQIPQLVEDVRFAVNNFGDVSHEKAAALNKLGMVVFKLGTLM